jgi:hypothetical protein
MANTAEAAGVSVTKTSNACTISYSTGAPKLLNASMKFLATAHGGNPVVIAYPEISSASDIATAVKLLPVRYNYVTGSLNAPLFTVSGTGITLSTGNVSVQMNTVSGQDHVFILS